MGGKTREERGREGRGGEGWEGKEKEDMGWEGKDYGQGEGCIMTLGDGRP
jgi:hypothetical protein